MIRAEVVIIGAGPAGIATAIQLKRYGLQAELLEQDEIGGLLRNAHCVENYPGFPEGINGLALVELFRKQLQNAGVSVRFEKALELNYRNDEFVTSTNRSVITSPVVVIATGTKPKRMINPPIPIPIEKQLLYEVYPILGIGNKKIAIIGAGDAAFDYACSLSPRNKVVILNQNTRAKCIPILEERCLKSGNVAYQSNVRILTMTQAGDRVSLTCARNHGQEPFQIQADYVIAAIGREASLDFLHPDLKESAEEPRSAHKLYFVGDVKNGMYRQTAISVGDGLRAAMEIYQHIGNHRP